MCYPLTSLHQLNQTMIVDGGDYDDDDDDDDDDELNE